MHNGRSEGDFFLSLFLPVFLHSLRLSMVFQDRLAYCKKYPILKIVRGLTYVTCKKDSVLMWVKGHAGVRGNEEADRAAKIRAYGGRVMQRPDQITPAGIRHEYMIHSKPKHLRWSRRAVKGLSYIVTDRGPLKRWLSPDS